MKNTLLLIALSGLFAVGCNRNSNAPPAAAGSGSGSGSGAAPATAASERPEPNHKAPPDLAAWVASAGFTKGAAVAPPDFGPLPPGALATAFRFEASDSAVEALAVRYPNERYARPHVSDVRTPDPGGSKVARKVVQNGSLVVEVRGADPAAVARFASAVAKGLGVPPEAPAAGSGSGAPAQ